MGERSAELRASYDRVAGEYAARIADELAQKPFDRALLDQLAAEVGSRGTICDLGCGPGQVARYLHERGAAACGIDLSPEMVAEARRRQPGIDFQQGDIGDLAGVPDGAFGGVAAFYSLIHVERGRMVGALREIGRVLRPDGVLLIAFHVGDHVLHLDEWWGQRVSIDFNFFAIDEMVGWLREAGFGRCEVFERGPYEGVEAATRRAYIFARQERGDGEASVIRRARPDEAGIISEVAFRSKAHWEYDAAFMEAAREDLTISAEEIAATDVYALVVGGRVVGFSRVRGEGQEAELADLFLDPVAIGKGLGGRLWRHAVLLARARGCRSLVLQSDPHAEGFYRAMGMVRVGESPSTVFAGRVLPLMRVVL